MSTYVWMRVLESSCQRYDFGVRLLSLGHIRHVYDRAEQLARGPAVLDLGCGTGSVALRLARRGFNVTGLDLSPQALDVARQKVPPHTPIRWIQAGALELVDQFPAGSFDTIVSVLLFSELSNAEQAEALRQCHVVLRPGGQLILADEVRPPTLGRRALRNLIRLPLAALTYVLTQATTEPVRDLEAKVGAAHFTLLSRETNRLGDFALLQAEKREVNDAVAA